MRAEYVNYDMTHQVCNIKIAAAFNFKLLSMRAICFANSVYVLSGENVVQN